jgi:23S rRNA (adenine1618-N6)-methyltransferase
MPFRADFMPLEYWADVTPIALEWAQRNLQNNPQLSLNIEVRRAGVDAEDTTQSSSIPDQCGIITPGPIANSNQSDVLDVDRGQSLCDVNVDKESVSEGMQNEDARSDPSILVLNDDQDDNVKEEEAQAGKGSSLSDLGNSPVLVGVLKEGEKFDFCLCNPPFFEDIQEAGLNPRTACGGTVHEMVYPGGELAFITRIFEDSLRLRNQIQ